MSSRTTHHRAERVQFLNFSRMLAFKSGKGDQGCVKRMLDTVTGQQFESYPAVLAALSVGAHGVALERAGGGVAAWIHTFLGQENKLVNDMWT